MEGLAPVVIIDWLRSPEGGCLVLAVAFGISTSTRPRLSKHCRHHLIGLQVGDPEPKAAAEADERFTELPDECEEQELKAAPEA